MGRNIKFVIVFAVLVGVCALVEKGDAATYIVGDNLGWTIPTGGASTYTTWASQHVFRTGDILVFNFPTGIHDVAKVTKAAYDSCTTNSPISLITVGPANVTLDSPGEAYFICTFGQHCTAGQKLAINVSAASTPTPSPTPPVTPPAAPAPAPRITPPAAPAPAPGITPPVAPAPAPGITPPASPAPAPTPNITPPGAPAPTPTPAGENPPSPSPESTPAPPPGGGATPPSPPSPGSSPPPAGNVSPPSPPPPNSAPTRAISTSFVIFASIAMGIAI
ncbi:unnamed protein product [Fraxinus pennsylvanica]|uniref:Phytocyanin domain-containing protein n=1 Tax=Fraxinus pennsylvanica TaxID=56036 RepID=A0AAD2A6I7_9LAMI|nr:unnamed protein product [Fraxinus pennsylvanica]